VQLTWAFSLDITILILQYKPMKCVTREMRDLVIVWNATNSCAWCAFELSNVPKWRPP